MCHRKFLIFNGIRLIFGGFSFVTVVKKKLKNTNVKLCIETGLTATILVNS
jgi:hypothetical protein